MQVIAGWPDSSFCFEAMSFLRKNFRYGDLRLRDAVFLA
jgi:hypothetical protein